MTIMEQIHSVMITILNGSTNMRTFRATGMTMSARKPRRTSTGYMSSKRAARASNVRRYSLEFVRALMIVVSLKWASSML